MAPRTPTPTGRRLGEMKLRGREVGGAASAALEEGAGLLRLAPCWVPRDFLLPGYRMRLDPRDIFAFGTQRGGIDERWFSSCVEAANPGREADEGLSYCVFGDERFTFKDAVAALGAELVGRELWDRYERWPVFAKFFDNQGPIPLHMHQNEEQAGLVGEQGKPEAYYFPPQLNLQAASFPYTFFGLEPGVTKGQVRECLARWKTGDNAILRYSRAYAIEPGSGWRVPPGVLHAPGSLCTFEPQWGSDVTAMFQNVVEGRFISRDMLVANVPEERSDDLDFIVDQLDWRANLEERFKERYFLEAIEAEPLDAPPGSSDRWVVYGKNDGRNKLFSAKELTLAPGGRCRIQDPGAYGIVCTQGYGEINGQPLSSPSLVRFGELTEDEYFCCHAAAREGVVFENKSSTEPLVCLRYFGPDGSAEAPDHPSDSANPTREYRL